MTTLWLRLMAALFGPRPVEYRRTFSASVTGPVYLGGSVRAGLPQCNHAPFSPADAQWLHAAEYPLHRGTTVDDMIDAGRGR